MNKKNKVGIDPAFRKRGFAICVLDLDNSAYFKTFKNGFIDFATWLIHDRPDNAIYIVENSNLQNFCWQKNAMSVGKNQAASQYTVDLIKSLKLEVVEFSPLQKGKAWNERQFMQQVNFLKIKLLNYASNKEEAGDQRVALQLATKQVNLLMKLKKM